LNFVTNCVIKDLQSKFSGKNGSLYRFEPLSILYDNNIMGSGFAIVATDKKSFEI
jgi:hypothetical protein